MTGKVVTCNYCGEPAELVGGLAIYPHRPDLAGLKFWRCAPCDAYVGTHKDSKDHQPLGLLATKSLRRARNQGHSAFDRIWRSGYMGRRDCYRMLAEKMGISMKECHFSWFTEDQIAQAMEITKAYVNQLAEPGRSMVRYYSGK